MKPFIPIFLLAFLSSSFFFSGCSQEDGYTINPVDKLRLSVDTLSFDTVFSTLESTTAWLKIFNPNNKKIRISNISLRSGGTKGYHINVDGSSVSPFTNVDILAKDSLYLFVEMTPPEQTADRSVLVEDAILFETNGNQQQIVLQAYSQNATIWHGKTITSDTTLTAERPFLIYDSLVVIENVTLTIANGVNVHFHDGANMEVYGSVKVNGTQISPVTFRGDRLDDIFAGFPYDNYPGQWGGIRLKNTSFNNDWNYAHIRGANWGVYADSSSKDQSKLKITNSIIHNMVYNCIKSSNCQLTVVNCQLTNSGSYTVCLIGGQADFTFCTIANYQRLISRDGSPALALRSYKDYSLRSKFINTIVYGTQSNELSLDLTGNSQILGDINFSNCLLKIAPVLDSKYATNCIYSDDPHFLKLGTAAENYKYDFRIDSISSARNVGNPSFSKNLSFRYERYIKDKVLLCLISVLMNGIQVNRSQAGKILSLIKY